METKTTTKKARSGKAQIHLPKSLKKKNRDINSNGKSGNGFHQAEVDPFDFRELLRVLTEVRNGNLSARMPVEKADMSGRAFDMLNDII